MQRRAIHRPGAKGYQRLLALLHQGEKLGVQEICEELGVQAPAARRHRNMLARSPGAALDAEKRVYLCAPCSGPPSSVAKPGNSMEVIALCLAAGLRPLFEGTFYESRLRDVRDAALARSSCRGLHFEQLDKKFAFLRRGGDVSVAERGERLDDVISGILRHRRIAMRYEDYDGNKKDHNVAPLSLLVFDQNL